MYARERKDFARDKCDWLRYWRKCGDQRCIRHRASSGSGSGACFKRHWRQESKEFRVLVQFTFKFMVERRLPYQAALDAAYEHLLRTEMAMAAAMLRMTPPNSAAAQRHAERTAHAAGSGAMTQAGAASVAAPKTVWLAIPSERNAHATFA